MLPPRELGQNPCRAQKENNKLHMATKLGQGSLSGRLQRVRARWDYRFERGKQHATPAPPGESQASRPLVNRVSSLTNIKAACQEKWYTGGARATRRSHMPSSAATTCPKPGTASTSHATQLSASVASAPRRGAAAAAGSASTWKTEAGFQPPSLPWPPQAALEPPRARDSVEPELEQWRVC